MKFLINTTPGHKWLVVKQNPRPKTRSVGLTDYDVSACSPQGLSVRSPSQHGNSTEAQTWKDKFYQEYGEEYDSDFENGGGPFAPGADHSFESTPDTRSPQSTKRTYKHSPQRASKLSPKKLPSSNRGQHVAYAMSYNKRPARQVTHRPASRKKQQHKAKHTVTTANTTAYESQYALIIMFTAVSICTIAAVYAYLISASQLPYGK